MSEQYQRTNFGEDEFEIPPISLPSVPTTAGDSSVPTMAENLQNIAYSRSPEGSSRSPGVANQGSPQIHGAVAMSPSMRQTPDQARQSPMAPLSDSFSSGPMPTAPQNYDVHEVTSSSNFSQVSAEGLTDISNSTLNPQFPPHGLNIPPITQSTWMPDMNNSVATTSHHQPSYQPMVPGYPQSMPPDTILTTTYQSAISSINTMPQMAGSMGMGAMHPPMSIPGHVRISPPQQESSEDSDDNRPLSQFAAKQHLQPPQRVQPPPPPEVKETKKKPPKRKRKKDPNEPQKPVSAYALFFRDTQAAIKGSNPNASFGEVSKIVASMWDGLEAEQKQAYKQKTETAKREYLKKLAAYRASLVSKAAVEIEPDAPSKKKAGGLASSMYPMNPTSSPLMPMVPRAIAPKPMGHHPNLPMGHGAMLPAGGMMQPMHPMTQHMGSWYNPTPRYDASHAAYVYDDSREHAASMYTQWLHQSANLQSAVGQ